jgi:glutaconyl-CoA/methylmalonyl-CoA decarboxylase subunit gamma
MKYVVTINEKSYEVEVDRGVAQVLQVTTAAQQAAPLPVAPVQAPSPMLTSVGSAALPGSEMIESPMPGVVVEIVKAVGEKVKRGDTVLILEAMKMENEITATRDGTVAQILTTKGATVTTGTPLVAIV